MKRACGLDVHKETIFCATYDGNKYGTVSEYSTLTSTIRAMNPIFMKSLFLQPGIPNF